MLKKSLLLLLLLVGSIGLMRAQKSSITYSFEGSLDGWTVIDNDGDGLNWNNGSILLDGYATIPSHQGADCISSASFDDVEGENLTPDNFIVSPEKVECTTVSFWACAYDEEYCAEHFGVAVSTTDNTSASAFTTIQEWTMTAKNGVNAGNNARKTRNGKECSWYPYTVDLSAYAGEEIWIAIRHFDCEGMLYLNVDEVTLAKDPVSINFDFEDGVMPTAFSNDATYPWTVEDADNGSAKCIKSGNAGVASSESSIILTQVLGEAGYIFFDFAAFGEGSDSNDWDKCRFYIDDILKFDYGNHDAWEEYFEELSAGTHTFKWTYKKDGSVNPTGDYFAVDNINIAEGTPCVPVSTLSVNGRTFVANWNGMSDTFTLRYKLASASTWSTINGITENTYTLPTLNYGDYVAEVQADCNAGEWISTTFTVNDPSNYNVCVILEAHDVWGDGSGYQMLLDADATAYGTIIPESGGLTSSGDAPAGLYDNFEFLIPEDADGSLTTTHIVYDGEVAIMIPAGTYDWCITNPTPGDRLWIAGTYGDTPGRYDNFEFEADHTYRFLLQMYGEHDGVSLTVSGGTSPSTISSVALTGYTAPRWNENPDLTLEVPSGAHYSIASANWYKNGVVMSATDVFNDESAAYNMKVVIAPASGFSFDSNVTVLFNGDANVFDAANSHMSGNNFEASTITYHVADVGDVTIYDFEDYSLQGWTAIDQDGDGNNWEVLEGSDEINYHEGAYYVCSESYINYVGALTPDNWLVSPAAGNYSSISFWACGQDPSYASEVFGVFVSTDGNSWTQVGSDVTATGTDTEYTFDLSSYSKDAIWVAIRHYHVTDMFRLNLDYITLGQNAGVAENDANVFSVYPNPATSTLYIDGAEGETVSVYDATGRLVMQEVYNGQLNVSTLEKGIYAVRVGTNVVRFVKE